MALVSIHASLIIVAMVNATLIFTNIVYIIGGHVDCLASKFCSLDLHLYISSPHMNNKYIFASFNALSKVK